MTGLDVGFGKSLITPRVGGRLVGYSAREAASEGVHDDLYARAMVVKAGADTWALCAVDFCYVRESTVAAVRNRVADRAKIPASHTFIATIHTHSGPDDGDAGSWQRPIADLIADAVLEAGTRLTPARIGAGLGVLCGHSINRRRLERPVDPAVGVIRVDDADGRPLGMVANFGCHAVVLGADNLLISADWPGVAAGAIETALGDGAVCLVTQGGSGDVNPLTGQVRQRLRSGQAIATGLEVYHGGKGKAGSWNIYERKGGTFAEVAQAGEAVAREALRVAAGIGTSADVEGIWAAQLTVNGARRREAGAFLHAPASKAALTERPAPSANPGRVDIEVMALGIDGAGILIVGQPGEIFAETAIAMRKGLQRQGYRFPMIVGYANGWKAYLPPFDAFVEGGYEVSWPGFLGIGPHVQDVLWGAVQQAVLERNRLDQL